VHNETSGNFRKVLLEILRVIYSFKDSFLWINLLLFFNFKKLILFHLKGFSTRITIRWWTNCLSRCSRYLPRNFPIHLQVIMTKFQMLLPPSRNDILFCIVSMVQVNNKWKFVFLCRLERRAWEQMTVCSSKSLRHVLGGI
jgi:hypothetical protein